MDSRSLQYTMRRKKYYNYEVTLTGAEPAAPAAPVAVLQQYRSSIAALPIPWACRKCPHLLAFQPLTSLSIRYSNLHDERKSMYRGIHGWTLHQFIKSNDGRVELN